MYVVFVWSAWNEALIKVIYTEYRRVWFCPLPSIHTLTPTLLIIRDKKCWLLITLGWACGMFEADTFVLPRDIKTHIWIRCDGCIITTMTSHPIDKTDGRQDSWQHGTKLVCVAVPSVVCCHDRGGSYYLHGCPRSLPGWIGLVLVSEEGDKEGGGGGGSSGVGILEMKGWIDQGPAFASPQLPLSIVAGRLGLLIELWTFLPKEPLGKGSVQINMGTSFGTKWHWLLRCDALFACILNPIHLRKRRVESVAFHVVMIYYLYTV